VVGVPLASGAPAPLSELRNKPVRVASRNALCDARISSVFVAGLASRGAGNTHREAPMTSQEEITETFGGAGDYAIALLEGGCRDGIIATTRARGTPAHARRVELSPAENAAVAFAYQGTQAALDASAAMTEERDDLRFGGVWSHAFAFPDGHRLTFVAAHIPQMGCDPDDVVFPVVFEQRSDETRLVTTPRTYPSLVMDIEGDGSTEVVFSYGESHLDVYSLARDGRALELRSEMYIGTSIGC
jgi:hypothetical protein